MGHARHVPFLNVVPQDLIHLLGTALTATDPDESLELAVGGRINC